MTIQTTASYHFFRRRARASERWFTKEFPQLNYKVVRAQRAPYRWRVVRYRKEESHGD